MDRMIIKSSFIFGLFMAILSIVASIVIASLAEGSLAKGVNIFLSNGIFSVLVPLTIGFQMSLFWYHRKFISNKSYMNKFSFSGSITSSSAMIFCCLHHITNILPTVGFLAGTISFMIEFKDLFIILGIGTNILLIIYYISVIIKNQTNINSMKTKKEQNKSTDQVV